MQGYMIMEEMSYGIDMGFELISKRDNRNGCITISQGTVSHTITTYNVGNIKSALILY